MPKKASVEDIENEIQQDKTAPRCSHVNRQHYGASGKLEELNCDLEKGHGGDHHAVYDKKVPDPQYDEKGRTIKVNYSVEKGEAYWGDLAGTLASEITEAPILQMNLNQKDMVMKVLSQSPAMTVKEAIARAKLTQEWNAV